MERINELTFKGIEDGRQAFIGPKIVQIDLTGRCNNNCIGCWVHSPFIKNPPRDKNVTLPFEKVKAIIEDLSYLETEEIFLAGSGEPFLHPNIMEIIELIKNKGLKLNIITNFTLINEEKAKKLIDLGVDLITASIWAGTEDIYIKTHPNKTKEDFYKIKENLSRLSQLKIRENKFLPHIKIYNVICNQNYDEINQMIDFALDTQVGSIEFQLMDIVENETSFLALSDGQIENIKEQFNALTKRKDSFFKELVLFNLKSPKEKEFNEFNGRFVNVPQGYSFLEEIIEGQSYNDKFLVLRRLICPKGISTKPSGMNPICDDSNNFFIFKFSKEDCEKFYCSSCLVDREEQLKIRFLRILGFNSFMRRINSTKIIKQIYEKDIIDKIPCYIGWIYSRILSTGEVIPCCKAADKPLDNIYKNSFLDIWNSSAYQKFRHKARFLPKNDPYFKEINCYKSCDNVGMNLKIKESISSNEKPRDLEYQIPVKRKEGEGELPEAKVNIIIPAYGFQSGNLNIQEHPFGKGLVIDGGCGFGFAEYEINFKEEGKYELWSYYVTEEERPVELYFDGNLITKEALSSATSGWTAEDLCWFKESSFEISAGKHILRIFTKGFIPHIHSFAFIKRNEDTQGEIEQDLSENIYLYPSSLRPLKDKFKTIGFFSTIFRLLDYILSGRLINNYLDILGIFNSKYAFKGPFHVQIDLTNNCNNNCIGCWCNSPLLGEKALSPEVKRQVLPFDLVKELLDELSQMGTKEIYFSGGGEPFMHPRIMEILEYAKIKKLICYVNTNFTLLDKEKIERLIDLEVEHLTVSTWAATPKTYALTHPNKNEEIFRQITENLKFLNRIKRKTPYIKLYNVIFSLNYHELKEIIQFAKETGSESAEFTLIDTIPGKTDSLLLNSNQIKQLQISAQEIAKELDRQGYWDGVLLFRFDSFLRRISSSSDLSKATYDRNIIDKIPCYIGWCFSRIMPNGDVNACLKAHRIPIGNLYQKSFSEIWNGEKQRYFRKKTLVYEKKDPFFRLIGNDPDIKEAGCYKSCDDIGRNIYMHNRIMSLTHFERSILKTASKIKQKPSLNLDPKDKSKDSVIRGIINGRQAFIGPEQVVIDITNRCNERCVGCWLYSPLLKHKPDSQWLKQEIDFSKVKSLIDELSDLGTKRIRFTGGGEPFMHPKIMELIEYTKNKGLVCCLTTNFSLLDKKKIRDLIRLEVDELAISLWTSNKETYQKTHPGVSQDMFERIKANLKILTTEKKDKPFITLCNVICNLNYQEVKEMFRFALDMKADSIYFTLIDTLEGTDALLSDRRQREEVLKQAEEIQKIWQTLPQEKRIRLDYFDSFISRLKEEGSWVGNYDQKMVNQIPCYVGWFFARILADGGVSPCCRGVKKILGNINAQSFKDIWFSQNYNDFRTQAKYLPKTDPYFAEIGCIKMCDNLMHNEEIHSRLNL